MILQLLYHYIRANFFSMKTLDTVALQAEYGLILQTLIETDFNKSKAAVILGVDRKTLHNKLNQIRAVKGIQKPKVVFAEQ